MNRFFAKSSSDFKNPAEQSKAQKPWKAWVGEEFYNLSVRLTAKKGFKMQFHHINIKK